MDLRQCNPHTAEMSIRCLSRFLQRYRGPKHDPQAWVVSWLYTYQSAYGVGRFPVASLHLTRVPATDLRNRRFGAYGHVTF